MLLYPFSYSSSSPLPLNPPQKYHSPKMTHKQNTAKNCYFISWEKDFFVIWSNHLKTKWKYFPVQWSPRFEKEHWSWNYSTLLPFILLVTETCNSRWGCVSSVGERILTEETRRTRRKKTCPLSLFLSQLSHGTSWYRKPPPAMTNRWYTAWEMTWIF
jgi:hypothetical protein